MLWQWLLVLLVMDHFSMKSSYAEGYISRLHSDGRYLKNERGEAVILRGVNIADPEHINLKRVGKSAVGIAETAILDFHAKVLRLPVHPGNDGITGFFVDPERYLREHLHPVIERCLELGVYAIIELHYVANYRRLKGKVLDFWRIVASRYRDYPNVIFEIFNEAIYPSSWRTWLSTIAQPTVDLIRGGGGENLIVVGGPEWNTKIGGAVQDPVLGSNIAYAAHIYPVQSERAWGENYGALLSKYPVFVTEWGYEYGEGIPVDGTTTGFGVPLLDWLKQNGLSWTAWIFDNTWESRMFDDSWGLKAGEYGMGLFVKEAL